MTNEEVLDDAKETYRRGMIRGSERLLQTLRLEHPERFGRPRCHNMFIANQVMRFVADFFQLTPEDIKGRSRKQTIVDARYCVVYMLRKKGWSLRQIGAGLGGRDHKSILYFTKWLEKCLKRNPKAREFVNLNS